ncbi:MAG TPA: PRC-barrel domain-containing protein [Dongiaceae bacterium]|nr:PRC-barrel domain-containing protein [Dongiaceae bacterium]
MKRFLMTTALVAATALPMSFAYAQSSGDTTTPQAPSATTPMPAAPAANAPADNNATPGATAAAPTPPPSEAIIAAPGSGDLGANKIIGMKVYNPNGDEVGKVKDVLFDANGNIKGVVLNVGGVLGIGAKPVGLQWKEVDVEPSNDIVKVNYTKEQLEAAPRFETPDTSPGDSGNVSNQPSQPMTPTTPAPGSAPAQQ